MERAPEAFLLDRLRVRSWRLTRQRQAILTALAQSGRALTADEVWNVARGQCGGLGLATVYRALTALEEMGVLRRVHGGTEGSQAFALSGAEHGHSVICESCGRVAEFSQCQVDSLVQKAAAETGYVIHHHLLELSGLCADCQAGRGSAPATRLTLSADTDHLLTGASAQTEEGLRREADWRVSAVKRAEGGSTS